MTAAWEDPRISRGMAAQLRRRRELLDSGHKALGWKLAFGGPAALERLHINAPLVGFLTDRALVPSGSTLSLSGWTKPAAEPEITVFLGKDLPAGAHRRPAQRGPPALRPPIQTPPVDHPPDSPRRHR